MNGMMSGKINPTVTRDIPGNQSLLLRRSLGTISKSKIDLPLIQLYKRKNSITPPLGKGGRGGAIHSEGGMKEGVQSISSPLQGG